MSFIDNIINNLPEVQGPTQKTLSFKEKLKWTGIILLIFFILGIIPLYGLGEKPLADFKFLSLILGASFGSLISLGIGPIVTASIVLQLLNGSGLLKFDLKTHEGKRRFQGIQKILSFFFIVFEAAIYVFLGGLAPSADLIGTPLYFSIELLLVIQLCLGGVLIMFMDEVVSKWGFGSGISLFIAAGVSQEIFIRAISWLPGPNSLSGYTYSTGAIIAFFQALGQGDETTALLMLAAVIATIVVFLLAVYTQSMKIEIPLSFGRIRGQGIRWPLNFMYTSNIPVILISALIANFQLWARLLQNAGHPFLGTFAAGSSTPQSGFIFWIHAPNLVEHLVTGTTTWTIIAQAFTYTLFLVIGSVVFSWFWVQTAGMDARSQADQISASGLQIPGFRQDKRILERILERYITPLTIMGAIAVGLMASIADLSGALSRGTGILLTVMIVYKLYEDIAKQHMMDMNPMLRKMMGQ